MEITNNQIWDKLTAIELKIDSLHRFKHSDKFNILREEVKIRRRMITTAVMGFLGVSRNWALDRMKKLGEEEHFKFILGDKNTKRTSLILYQEEQAMRSRYKKIIDLVDQYGEIRFAKICSELKLDLEKNLDVVRSLAGNIVENENGYYIKGGHTLCKEL